MGINSFKSAITDLARQNRFEIQIPGVVDPPHNKLCINAELPGITLSTEPLYDSLWTGANLGSGNSFAPFQMPYDVIIKEMPLTFMDTKDFALRKKFDTWFKDVFDPKVGLGYMVDYVKNVIVVGLDRQDFPQYTATLLNAWPMDIGEIQFDSSSADSYATFTVTLAYSNFTLN
jgi:hypothetical protein